MAQLLDAIHGPDKELREKAADRLEAIAEDGLSVEQGVLVLRATTRPDVEVSAVYESSSEFLIKLLWNRPDPQYVAIVNGAYAKLNNGARNACLALVADTQGAEAADTYVDLLEEHGWPEKAYPRVTMGFERNPRHADILFPRLIQVRADSLGDWHKYSLLLAYLKAKAYSTPPDSEIPALLVAAYRSRVDRFSKGGESEKQIEDRADAVQEAGLLLDVMGYVKAPAVIELLREAVREKPSEVRLWAVASLLRHEQVIPDDAVSAVAADARTRCRLFSCLEEQGQLDRMPAKYRSAQALAESSMVEWLEYPTELAAPPDEIELMKSLEVETETGKKMTYFLFRFRMNAPHWAADDGWQAGIAGPFDVNNPKANATDTFSQFEKWDSKTPEEHMQFILDTLEKAQQHALEPAKKEQADKE